jgi:hypothetical protein
MQMQRSQQEEIRTAKTARDTAAARKRIDRAISSSVGKGPITKQGLIGEWDQIVDKLSVAEGGGQGGKAGKAEKRPWKRP